MKKLNKKFRKLTVQIIFKSFINYITMISTLRLIFILCIPQSLFQLYFCFDIIARFVKKGQEKSKSKKKLIANLCFYFCIFFKFLSCIALGNLPFRDQTSKTCMQFDTALNIDKFASTDFILLLDRLEKLYKKSL